MTSVMSVDANLAGDVEKATGVNVHSCLQCRRCSLGCPMAESYDILPHRMVRAVQEGDPRVRTCKSVWLCASCHTCVSRCPQEIDLPAVIDHFRHQTKDLASVPEVARFHKVFLSNAARFGRIYELGMMGELNLREGKPFRDLRMGLRMMRKGKIKFLPDVKHKLATQRRQRTSDNQVAYYPGCSLHSTGIAFAKSFEAVCRELDIELNEIPGWTCCGATPAHASDPDLALRMPMMNLILAEKAGYNAVVSPCAACFSRLKSGLRHYRDDAVAAHKVDEAANTRYDDTVSVLNATQCLERMAGDRIEARVKRPLAGLKVACYYGCLLTRPPRDTGEKEYENPQSMEFLVRALGGVPVAWGRKTDCCGGSLGVTHTVEAKKLTADILREAKGRGADVVAVACPLCQVNLDERQPELASSLGFTIPVLYITQLMAHAMGLSEREQALNYSAVEPTCLGG